jgi:deoxyribodipyrimidine photolyase-related protein
MPGTSLWILGDQLHPDHPGLEQADRVVMVESAARARRRPVHRRKLTLLFSAMRHRAAELEGAGLDVDYRKAEATMDGLEAHVATHRPERILTMEASEWAGARFQASLGERLGVRVEVAPNTQMLAGRFDPFPDVEPTKPVVMERFYRRMRVHFGLLLDPAGEPAGGAWNFDAENRRPYPREGLRPPPVPSHPPDATTREVMAVVESMPGIGSVDGFDLAVTRERALQALDDFLTHRLASFGPHEDAMSAQHGVLYHSVLSPYLNLGLLDPLEACRAAEAAYTEGRVPINSVEGFVRQIAGWREFVYWNYRRLMPELARMNDWDHHLPLPAFFWTGDTDLRCMSTVIRRVLDTGYSHHIERLMVLCNFAMLAGVDPREVNEWFLSCYVDAYEWVVTPNVVGMGLNADGGIVATKPYVASGRYIDRMSDFCRDCRYDPAQRTGDDACPFNPLYWDFLLRNERRLRANPRLGPAVLGLRHLDEDERRRVVESAARFRAALGEPPLRGRAARARSRTEEPPRP